MEFDQEFLDTIHEFWPSLRYDPQVNLETSEIVGYMFSDERSIFIFVHPYDQYSLSINGSNCHLNYQYAPQEKTLDDLHFWNLSPEETILHMIDLLDWYH